LSTQAKEAREKAAAVAVPAAMPSPYLPLDKFDEVDESKTAAPPVKPKNNALVVQQIDEALKDILEANSAVQAAQDKQKNVEDALKKVKLELESPNAGNSSANGTAPANATVIPQNAQQNGSAQNIGSY
jgi:hypothetical protein